MSFYYYYFCKAIYSFNCVITGLTFWQIISKEKQTYYYLECRQRLKTIIKLLHWCPDNIMRPGNSHTCLGPRWPGKVVLEPQAGMMVWCAGKPGSGTHEHAWVLGGQRGKASGWHAYQKSHFGDLCMHLGTRALVHQAGKPMHLWMLELWVAQERKYGMCRRGNHWRSILLVRNDF